MNYLTAAFGHSKLQTPQRVALGQTGALTVLALSLPAALYQYALGPHVPLVIATPGGSSTPETHGQPSAIARLCRRKKEGLIGPEVACSRLQA